MSVVGEGEIGFQEYFVGRHHDVPIDGVRFAGVEDARPAPGVLEALRDADVVVDRAVEPDRVDRADPRRARRAARCSTAAGPAWWPCRRSSPAPRSKGPADRMLRELGGEASVVEVARRYRSVAGVARGRRAPTRCRRRPSKAEGVSCVVTPTVMRSPDDRRCAGRHGARRRVSVPRVPRADAQAAAEQRYRASRDHAAQQHQAEAQPDEAHHQGCERATQRAWRRR